jgi:Tfp pilus assembly protein PilN
MTARLADQLASVVPPGVQIDASKLTGSPAIIAALPPGVRDAVRESFVTALTGVFWFAIPVLLVAFGFALFLPEQRLRTREEMMAAMQARQTPADAAAEAETNSVV